MELLPNAADRQAQVAVIAIYHEFLEAQGDAVAPQHFGTAECGASLPPLLAIIEK